MFIIYKQTYDSSAGIYKIEIIEADMNEASSIKYTKLYNLQVPNDLKNRVQYHQQYIDVL